MRSWLYCPFDLDEKNSLRGVCVLMVVELFSGEKLIGFVMDSVPTGVVPPELMKKLNDGIYLRRQRTLSYLAHETIKNIRVARPGEEEITF